MTLTADYQVFLSTANPELLAKDAQLHYIPTTTSFREPTPIVKHLASQAKALKKKQENIISSIESDDAICLDIETTIEFVSSGGAYLPGLDDNLLSDRIVTFPIVHIVRFDPNGKIQQIRQQWDQATLLRSVEVIGSRARNWPITDGEAQIKLIVRSTNDAPGTADDVAKKLESTSLASAPSSRRGTETHTARSLGGPRDEQERETSREPSVATREARRPPTRDWDELFPGAPSDASSARSASPSKVGGPIAPKAGSGKNFAPSRLFDTDGPENARPSPMKTDAKKYSHFEFYDGHDAPAPAPSQPRPKTKHQSQWDFADFTTPAKVKQRQNTQSSAQFEIGNNDDTPLAQKQNQARVRPAEATHFELQDDGVMPADNRPRHARGHGSTNISHALYTDHTLPESEHYTTNKDDVYRDIKNVSQKDRGKDFNPHFSMNDDPSNAPSGGYELAMSNNATATNLKDRKKDFGNHWEITDAEPGLGERSSNDNNRPSSGHHQKAVNTMTSSWAPTDLSPANNKTDRNEDRGPLGKAQGKENRGINIGGDGMGGRAGTARDFLAGDDQPIKSKGITIAGNGMGGRSTTERSWGIGADEPEAPKPKPRQQHAAYKSDLWDF